MLFHASISAHEPERVARLIAALWGGDAHPFPPCPGAWIAVANDDRGSAMEVSPHGLEMTPGETEVGYVTIAQPSPTSASHHAIATSLSEAEVAALAAREGWRTLRCLRGSPERGFEVIELWLENRILIEVLPPAMQRRYLEVTRPGHWERLLASAEG